MNKLGKATAGIFLTSALLLGACGETEVEQVDSGTKTETVEADATEQATDKVFAVGDTVKVNGLQITITEATYTEPEEYTEPANGKVLTLTLDTENTGDSAFIDSNEFNLYDSEGNQLEAYYGYMDMAISGDINKGKKLAGKLYYDVAEAESYELIYKPSFSFDDKEIKWNIAVK